MSELDKTTEIWVLQAKVERLTKALAEAVASEAAHSSEAHRLRTGVRQFAHTLRAWAVAAGGHTPSAIIASRLLELIGDEKPVSVEVEPSP